MTTREIKQAIKDGCVVVLRHDPRSRLCYDLFDNLVVVSLSADEPIRLATVSDKRRAEIMNEE